MTRGILEILAELIACDTQNPPREIGANHPVFDVIGRHLQGRLDFEMSDHGNGSVSLLARRGNPDLLFNVHLDTVPVGVGWTADPLQMRMEQDRVIGRGVCDIKGAAACLIEAAKTVETPVALLFTTDEEGSDSCCVRNFCQSPASQEYSIVVVAEPTECQAVSAHRGYLSVRGQFDGVAAHSSQFQDLPASAVHRAINWASSALQAVDQFEARHLDGQSVCFNIGRIEGGTKNNVVADQCRLTWGMRPPPGTSPGELLNLVTGDTPDFVDWETAFSASALPAGNLESTAHARAIEYCRQRNISMADAVDFWTEASIFSESGISAFVLGPGNIAQAHTVDEWVTIAQLEKAGSIYKALMTNKDAPGQSSVQ